MVNGYFEKKMREKTFSLFFAGEHLLQGDRTVLRTRVRGWAAGYHLLRWWTPVLR